MSEPAANLSAETGLEEEKVTCSKCGAENPPKGHRCCGCGAHLYVRCYHCRERVERALLACPACGKSMKAPPLRRLKRKLREGNAPFLWLAAVVIFFLVLGIFVSSHFLSRPPETAKTGKTLPPVKVAVPAAPAGPAVDGDGDVDFPGGK